MSKKIYVICLILLCFATFQIFAEDLSIDMNFDTKRSNPRDNFLVLVYENQASVDGYDAISGASKLQTTKELDAFRYDSFETKNLAMPEGLRSLLLYAVNSWKTAKQDNFKVTKVGDNLIITFIHRNNAYRITATNGLLSLASSFEIAKNVCVQDNGVFKLKPEYVLKPKSKLDKMSSADFAKMPFVPDTSSPEASRYFSGELQCSLKKHTLVVKGTLQEIMRF